MAHPQETRVAIVIPTLNEADNVRSLCEKVFLYIPDAAIIFVDDNSTDGTKEILAELAYRNGRIKPIFRQPPKSFAKSYLVGLRAALRQGASLIIQMDADFSHDPRYLPEILENLRDYHLVIGSRYIRGGGVKNWPWRRRFLSRAGNLFAKAMTGLKIGDLTGGFLGWQGGLLKKVLSGRLNVDGYAFLIEMKILAQEQHAKIREVPIVFVERRQGASKMSLKIIGEAILFCCLSRLNRFRKINSRSSV
ncbi:MAG: polyprenol monophosphomannose synthase [bacterium]|nr:polyprenol monophosphomannose synthase [bacterium]